MQIPAAANSRRNQEIAGRFQQGGRRIREIVCRTSARHSYAGPKDHGKGEHDYPAWQKSGDGCWPRQQRLQLIQPRNFRRRSRSSTPTYSVLFLPGAAVGTMIVQRQLIHFLRGVADSFTFTGRSTAAAGRARWLSGSACRPWGAAFGIGTGKSTSTFSPGAEHPIARNFNQIRWVDESYWLLVGDPSRIKLLGTSREDGLPQPALLDCGTRSRPRICFNSRTLRVDVR